MPNHKTQRNTDLFSVMVSLYLVPSDEVVGFTAFNDIGYQPLAKDDIVLFQGVRTNYGGYYEPTTSTFHCPVNGVYMFSSNVVSEINYSTRIDIMKNDVAQIGILAYTADISTSAGGLCITECFVGETVWIKARYSGAMDGGSLGGTHFSGYLLTLI